MKMLRKKGMMSTVQMLILFLAVTVVLTLFFIPFISWAGETTDKEACRLSVMAKYGGNKAKVLGGESNVALQCFTQELTITSEGIYKKGKDRKPREVESFPSYSNAGAKPPSAITSERKDLVKEVIANEMYDCWDQFWQGKLSIWTGGEQRCVICSEISFDGDWVDVNDEKDRHIYNFGDYLNTKKINKEQTYSNFFGGEFEKDLAVNTKVNTKIIFKGIGKSWLENNVGWLVGGGAVGCTMGGGVALPIATFAIIFGGPIGWIAGGVALAVAGTGCSVGVLVGAGGAAVSGGDWVPSMVIGPSAMVAESCDKLY